MKVRELIRTTLRNSNYPEDTIYKAFIIANIGPKICTSNEAITSNSITYDYCYTNVIPKLLKNKIKTIQFPFKICPLFYAQKLKAD